MVGIVVDFHDGVVDREGMRWSILSRIEKTGWNGWIRNDMICWWIYGRAMNVSRMN